MALTLATTSWQSVTLTHNEVWLVEKGSVKFYSGPSIPDDNDGGFVKPGHSMRFSSGLTVYYKTDHGSGDHAFARIYV